MAHMLPGFMAGFATRSVLGLVRLLNPEIPIGIHLCFGDLNNKALTNTKTLKKLVNFSNVLLEKWPKSHNLKYLHFPLAEADAPPELSKSYYESLKNVKMPAGVRFAAGFVHEKLNKEQHETLLVNIESVRGHQVDIACSCGLGRRDEGISDQLLETTAHLVNYNSK